MRPRKPQTLKIVSGTARNDRLTESVKFPLIVDMPVSPDWLPNAYAVNEWNRLVPLLMANKLLTEGALSALAILCSLHGKIVQLYSTGDTPTGHMISQYRNLINDFGLTPVSQGKVKAFGGEDKPNPFANNGKHPSA
ncbi:P27 family phage terminase small subunit [Nitrosomonas supralitoralis]|uniref:Phage terminase, small subunit n=1 Tax=Nitrosomonas supralitoralis TaxID=2116706 RepID=A0A2P7NXZ7_9PROT|nr:P27 family phage terminase small subunit [Nitrosomonas supralitoralis]PSJ18341.1 hypothetical protein C7H79_02925 [Nitrosomonas supralitoralis]